MEANNDMLGGRRKYISQGSVMGVSPWMESREIGSQAIKVTAYTHTVT